MSLVAVEQHLIDTVKGIFNNRLKTVESLPADFDADTFARILRLTPGVFIVFGGGQRSSEYDDQPVIDAKWGFIAATTHASGELARRRGDAREIGAYEIIETIVNHLHRHNVPGQGQLVFDDIQNLFTGEIERQGAALYGVEFTLPMSLGAGLQPGDLDDFITFDGTFDVAPADGQVDAEDLVTLPQ